MKRAVYSKSGQFCCGCKSFRTCVGLNTKDIKKVVGSPSCYQVFPREVIDKELVEPSSGI